MQDKIKNNSKDLVKILGKIIKKYRKYQKKTIYKISAEVSMSKSTWREVEIGACKDIKFTTLWKISEALDIPLSDVITDLQKELGENFSLTDIK